MGAAEGLRAAGVTFAGIGWPQDVVDTRTYRELFALRMHAGYDKGMFGSCTVVAGRQIDLFRDMDDDVLAQALDEGIRARVALWEEQIVAGAGKAGPLAPVLSEYFDLVPLLGQPAAAVYPNGNEMARGRFAGVDIWGRATLVTDDGRELEFSPEQASVVPA
jgi:BirA family biotin operon repressor/biotin-[acetyl-CoA-carboxylase] ligase